MTINKTSRRTFVVAAAAVAMAFSAGTTMAQTKWDMPTPYSPAIFHTENIQQFANDVEKASGGKIELLIERVLGEKTALAHIRASKSPKAGTRLTLEGTLEGHLLVILDLD